jgi:hypothetical protein
MRGLAPEQEGSPLAIEGGTFAVTVTGASHASQGQGAPPSVIATPTFVLVNDSGYVTTVAGDEFALDDAPHKMVVPGPGLQALPAGKWRIVAIDLLFGEHSGDDLISWGDSKLSASVSVHVDGSDSNDGPWGAASNSTDRTVSTGTTSLAAQTVTASFSYSVLQLSWQDAHLTLLSFPASTEVPIAMTESLASSLGLADGDKIAMVWGTTTLDARLVRTIPYVPSHVREDAVLVDLTSFDRELLSAGNVD